MVPPLPRTPQEAAVLLALYLVACKLCLMFHKPLEVNTAIQTPIVGTTHNHHSNHEPPLHILRTSTTWLAHNLNNNTRSKLLMRILHVRPAMVVKHKPTIRCPKPRSMVNSTLSRPAQCLVSLSRNKYSYQTTWLEPSSVKEVPRSTRSDILVAASSK